MRKSEFKSASQDIDSFSPTFSLRQRHTRCVLYGREVIESNSVTRENYGFGWTFPKRYYRSAGYKGRNCYEIIQS